MGTAIPKGDNENMEIIVELEAKCQSYDIEVEKLTAENGKIKVKKRYVMFRAIWYYLYNLKNVKNIHGRVLLLVRLKPATLLKVALLHWCFSHF